MPRPRTGSWSRTAPWCLLLAALAVGEDSCPAGGGGSPACRAAAESGGGPDAGGGSATGAKSSVLDSTPPRQEDLITQEVEELEAFMKLSADRVRLLKELQGLMASSKGNLSLPDSHVRALREKVPMLSEVAADVDGGASAAAEDYLVSKAIIPQEDPVDFIKFMPLRNPRSSSGSSSGSSTAMPTTLLVAAQADSTVRLFTPSGELVLSFTAGHEHPVTHLTVSPSHDEYMLATGDAGGVIRVHKVAVRQRRLTKDQRYARRNSTDEKVSQFLGSVVNVTATLHRQMQVPPGSDGEAPRVTALAVASQQGSKYFVAGDVEGKISVFTKNGTLRAKIDATATPGAAVEGLDAHLGSLLFRAGTEWGFVELDKQEVKHVECPKFEGRVAATAIDSQQASRILVADEQGSVWVFNLKNKKDCRLEYRFAKGSTRAPIELASIRGFVLGLEFAGASGEPASVLALNMSTAIKRSDRPSQLPSPVVWKRSLAPVRAWAVNKRYQQGDLIACLSQDGHEIEIMELLMQVYSAPANDSFGNFKLPVIAVAIVLVLGYQYMKQKGGGGGKFPGAGGLGGKKFDWADSDFAAALKNKRKLGAAGAGGPKLGKRS
uniref:Anaphase-promoting complex subunit 4 WD40 domain-containing protein n=1 Tax=Alexandrium monilatum TaxID=311494 RepID=A0A7S4UA69_9DINO